MDLEELLKSGKVIFLAHFGLVTQPLITSIIDALEKLDGEKKINFPYKLYVVFIEIAQNIMHYASKKDYQAFIAIGEEKGNYYIFSQNLVKKEDKQKIDSLLKEILALNKDEIKKLYKERRRSGKNSHKRGAGIGFLEIAKFAKKIEYEFKKVKDKYIFSLKVYFD